MKHLLSLLTLAAVLAVAGASGCKKSDGMDGGAGGGSAMTLDLSKVESAFAPTTGAIKAEWDKIALALKSQDYSGAWASLQSLAKNAALTDDQKSALSDLMAQIKAKTGDVLKSATDAAEKVAAEVKDAATKAR